MLEMKLSDSAMDSILKNLIWLLLMVDLKINVIYACLWTRVIRCCVPSSRLRTDIGKALYRKAAPIVMSPWNDRSPTTCPSELVEQGSFSAILAAYRVWAHFSHMPLISGDYDFFFGNRIPNDFIDGVHVYTSSDLVT